MQGSQSADVTINSSKTRNQRRQQLKNCYKKYQSLDPDSQFVLHLVLVKHYMDGTAQQKQKQIQKRINKFFEAGQKSIDLEKHQHFHERRQTSFHNLTINNELIVFGIDFLSSKDIRKRLPGLNPQILKLDDSHYKLTFPNAAQARRAMQINMINPEQLNVKMQEDEGDEVPRKWFDWKPYRYMVFNRNLQCRYATEKQDAETIKQSQQIKVYQRAKQQFQQSINSRGKQILRKTREQRRALDRDRSRQKPQRNRWESENDRSNNRRNQNRNYYNNRDNYDNRDSFRNSSVRENRNDNVFNDEQSEIKSLVLDLDIEEDFIKQMEKLSFSDNAALDSEFSINMNQSQFLNSQNQLNLSVEEHGSQPERAFQKQNHEFSYIDYMANQQIQEENRQKKKKKTTVIVLDDD